MKGTFANTFRVVLAALLALSLSSLAQAQHGGGHGGGGHGGGHGGHMHAGAERVGGNAKAHGITRYPPFSAVRFFTHRRHPRLRGPFVSNGLFVGGFADCGFWDWNCGLGWDDSYVDLGNWAYSAPGSKAPNSEGSTSALRPVAVLYLKDGYSVGVAEYWLENGELHYLTTYAGENAVPIGEIDLQRTVDENASNDVPFVLRPKQATPPPVDH
jgi:hypothetical protein